MFHGLPTVPEAIFAWFPMCVLYYSVCSPAIVEHPPIPTGQKFYGQPKWTMEIAMGKSWRKDGKMARNPGTGHAGLHSLAMVFLLLPSTWVMTKVSTFENDSQSHHRPHGKWCFMMAGMIPEKKMEYSTKPRKGIPALFWLVVWLPFFIFPYIGNNHPNWLIFFRGVQTTNQDCLILFVYLKGPLPATPKRRSFSSCPWDIAWIISHNGLPETAWRGRRFWCSSILAWCSPTMRPSVFLLTILWRECSGWGNSTWVLPANVSRMFVVSTCYYYYYYSITMGWVAAESQEYKRSLACHTD